MAEITDVQEFLSGTFGVPAQWFGSPIIILYLVVPFIGFTYIYYTLLRYRLKIFRRSSAPNLVIGACLAFFSIPTIVMNPYLIIAISAGAPIVLRRATFFRILLSLGLAAGAWFATVYLSKFLL